MPSRGKQTDKLFDDISRILASPIPRRRALRLIVSGLVGATFAAIGLQPAEAVTCTTDSQCGTGNVCCNGICCTKGQACVDKKCKKQPPSPTSP